MYNNDWGGSSNERQGTTCLQVFIKCDFGRLSSRFSEYIFQLLRCADKTSCVFGMLRAEELLRIATGQLGMELQSDLVFPEAKRGQARGRMRAYVPTVSYGPS